MNKINKIVKINEKLCIACEKCVKLCPKQILYIDKIIGKCKVNDENKCDRLKGCMRVCPTNAIEIN